MPYAGSRTKDTGTWLLPADENAFDRLLRERIELIAWRCSHPGPVGLHPTHMHPTLAEAMACGSVQAFLHLPFGAALPQTVTLANGVRPPAGPPTEATVQLLRARIRNGHDGRSFEAGRLAVRWYENEVSPETHRTLVGQTRQIWSALTAATRLVRVDGREKPLFGFRIGQAAEAMIRETGGQLAVSGVLRFRLR
ncbi:hypothetical protein Cco03nite_09290 [Catellatospora coxensis]|uniref:Uncharacterized protein n=2 Tax=Catellatospora coxensis TaxID=310354 RepID=A0A8J3KSH7_9ACTN|nr:hypothetical protein Cco03nite_09290 [Catellatospora coxensis]